MIRRTALKAIGALLAAPFISGASTWHWEPDDITSLSLSELDKIVREIIEGVVELYQESSIRAFYGPTSLDISTAQKFLWKENPTLEYLRRHHTVTLRHRTRKVT